MDLYLPNDCYYETNSGQKIGFKNDLVDFWSSATQPMQPLASTKFRTKPGLGLFKPLFLYRTLLLSIKTASNYVYVDGFEICT